MDQIKCSACGGNILFDEDKEVLFCPYCGAKVPSKTDALDKILKHDRQTRQFKEEIRQRKVQEHIDAEKRENKKTRATVIGIILFLIVSGLVCYFGIQGENDSEAKLNALAIEIQEDVAAGNYDVALIKTERLHWPHSDLDGQKRWDKQRESMKKLIREAKRDAEKKK